MSVTSPISTNLREQLQNCLLRVMPIASGQRLWEDVLTEADRASLGGDFWSAYQAGGTLGMLARPRHISSQSRAIVEAAYELGFLDERAKRRMVSELGPDEFSIEQTIADAIATGDLVLVDHEREVYWQEELIPVEWFKASALWNFFLILCERAKAGASLDRTHFGDIVGAAYPSKTKSKLCNKLGFPLSLADLIVPAGRGTVKLKLPPNEIHLFRVETHEVLTVVN